MILDEFGEIWHKEAAGMKDGQAAKTSSMLPILEEPEEERMSWMWKLSRILIILTPASLNL